MRVVILFREKSEHARGVETFTHDFRKRYADVRIELVNIDEREGIALASLYDIMQFPAIIAIADDGVLLQLWQGTTLPLIDEVASYLVRA